jgi:EmrB/QacA subfamily drug resistance transporter
MATPTTPDAPADSPLSGEHRGDQEAKSPKRKTIFAICAMGLFMSSIDTTIVATALPRIDHELHSPLNWAGWTITIYQLGTIITMPLAGRISDQFGRKRVFLICVAIFTVASLFCGLSTSIYMLIALRFLQALGGGAFMPSASGIVSDHFGKDRDRALGAFSTVFPVGGILGPVFGGVIAQDWSWRGIFFINIPVGIALVILGLRFIPPIRPTESARVDTVGVALLGATILSSMFGITSLGGSGLAVGSPVINFAVAEVVAVCFGYFFVRHIKRDPAPFIPYELLFSRGFGAMNILNILYGTGALGFAALVPLYAENRYHINLTSAGTLLSARSVGMISIAGLATYLLRRTGYRLPMIIGFVTTAISLVLLAIRAPVGVSPYLWLAGFSMLTGLGLGASAPATNNATMQMAPEHVAAIAGQRGMLRQSGGILYLSVVTALLSRSSDPGETQAIAFVAQAGILLVMTALVFRVPEHKGSW